MHKTIFVLILLLAQIQNTKKSDNNIEYQRSSIIFDTRNKYAQEDHQQNKEVLANNCSLMFQHKKQTLNDQLTFIIDRNNERHRYKNKISVNLTQKKIEILFFIEPSSKQNYHVTRLSYITVAKKENIKLNLVGLDNLDMTFSSNYLPGTLLYVLNKEIKEEVEIETEYTKFINKNNVILRYINCYDGSVIGEQKIKSEGCKTLKNKQTDNVNAMYFTGLYLFARLKRLFYIENNQLYDRIKNKDTKEFNYCVCTSRECNLGLINNSRTINDMQHFCIDVEEFVSYVNIPNDIFDHLYSVKFSKNSTNRVFKRTQSCKIASFSTNECLQNVKTEPFSQETKRPETIHRIDIVKNKHMINNAQDVNTEQLECDDNYVNINRIQKNKTEIDKPTHTNEFYNVINNLDTDKKQKFDSMRYKINLLSENQMEKLIIKLYDIINDLIDNDFSENYLSMYLPMNGACKQNEITSHSKLDSCTKGCKTERKKHCERKNQKDHIYQNVPQKKENAES